MREAVQAILTDRRIDHTAVKFWLYVAANPASKELLLSIAEKIGMGRPAATKAWKKLYKHGYLKVTKLDLGNANIRLVFRPLLEGEAVSFPKPPKRGPSKVSAPTQEALNRITDMKVGETFQARLWSVPNGTWRHVARAVRYAHEFGLIEPIKNIPWNGYSYQMWRRK